MPTQAPTTYPGGFGKPGTNTGKSFSPEWRRNQSASLERLPKLTCTNCGLTGGYCVMKAKHFEHCPYPYTSPDTLKMIADDHLIHKTPVTKLAEKYGYSVRSLRRMLKQGKYSILPYIQRCEMTDLQRDLLDHRLSDLVHEHVEQQIPLAELGNKYGFAKWTLVNAFRRNGIPVLRFPNSYPEREIGTFLTSLGVPYETNNRTLLKGKELDIYIPSKKVAIELNGIFWHNDTRHHKRHLLDKTEACAQLGIRLLHIFDVEWQQKRTVIQSIIRSALGLIGVRIFARKCTLKTVESHIATQFLNTHHLQRSVRSPINIGLYHHDELVALMTFSKSRFGHDGGYEMVRFCNKEGVLVVGGAEKLFRHFCSTHTPSHVVSYADRRLFVGGVYARLGFEFSHTSPPNYYYFRPNEGEYRLHSRVQFQKHKLPNRLSSFDASLTEYQNMLKNGWFRIWDCGNHVYKYQQTTDTSSTDIQKVTI